MTLERKTGLKRGAPLKANPKKTQEWQDRSRTKKKTQGAAPKRTEMKRRKSPKVKAYEAEFETMRVPIGARSGGMCEAQLPLVCMGRAPIDEDGRAFNIHHRQARPVGPNTMENLLHLCGSGTTGCHGWIEGNVTKAREMGLLIKKSSPPPSTPWVRSRKVTRG